MKKLQSLPNENLSWLILPIFALILMLPFLNPEYLIRGHDTELHLNRVVGFVEAINSGQFHRIRKLISWLMENCFSKLSKTHAKSLTNIYMVS